jgi:hypothetical protein
VVLDVVVVVDLDGTAPATWTRTHPVDVPDRLDRLVHVQALRCGVAKPKPPEDLATASPDELAKAVAQLSPDEALFFLAKLEAVMNKRKLQLTGYLVALAVWLVAMLLALAYYGTHDGFVGWVFLLPFFLVGVILFAFGKWSDAVGKRVEPILARERAKPTAAVAK